MVAHGVYWCEMQKGSRGAVARRVRDVLGSRWFWRVSVGFFAAQAAYIALVGRFSMAFDEFYHLGAIRAYAKVWAPWQVQQPSGPATLGALTADGSYLYHYLMSFPYRIITSLTHDQTIQIISLRLIDIGFVIVGLYIFRRLLSRLGMSAWSRHLVLAGVMLLPVTPQLAGQLTYDTLFFMVSGLVFLALVRLVQDFRRSKQLWLVDIAWVLTLTALACQVKYAFLPLALGGVGYIIWMVLRDSKKGYFDMAGTWLEWRQDIARSGSLFAVGVLMLAAVLFVQRFGLNLVRYGSVTPNCAAVLGEKRCLAFDPYARDNGFERDNLKSYLRKKDKALYPITWGRQMVRELYFTVGPRDINYPPGLPLPVSYITGYIIIISGLAIVLLGAKRLWRKSDTTRLLIVVSAFYVMALFVTNMSAYLSTGVPVAIHGRYVLQLLPLWGFLVYAVVVDWKRLRAYRDEAQMVALALLIATAYGGGISPFIIRSWDQWYWPHAVQLSRIVRSLLWPFILR